MARAASCHAHAAQAISPLASRPAHELQRAGAAARAARRAQQRLDADHPAFGEVDQRLVAQPVAGGLAVEGTVERLELPCALGSSSRPRRRRSRRRAGASGSSCADTAAPRRQCATRSQTADLQLHADLQRLQPPAQRFLAAAVAGLLRLRWQLRRLVVARRPPLRRRGDARPCVRASCWWQAGRRGARRVQGPSRCRSDASASSMRPAGQARLQPSRKAQVVVAGRSCACRRLGRAGARDAALAIGWLLFLPGAHLQRVCWPMLGLGTGGARTGFALVHRFTACCNARRHPAHARCAPSRRRRGWALACSSPRSRAPAGRSRARRPAARPVGLCRRRIHGRAAGATGVRRRVAPTSRQRSFRQPWCCCAFSAFALATRAGRAAAPSSICSSTAQPCPCDQQRSVRRWHRARAPAIGLQRAGVLWPGRVRAVPAPRDAAFRDERRRQTFGPGLDVMPWQQAGKTVMLAVHASPVGSIVHRPPTRDCLGDVPRAARRGACCGGSPWDRQTRPLLVPPRWPSPHALPWRVTEAPYLAGRDFSPAGRTNDARRDIRSPLLVRR